MSRDTQKINYRRISELVSRLSSGGNRQSLAYQFLNAVHAKDKERFSWLLDRLLASNLGSNLEEVNVLAKELAKIDLDYESNLVNLGYAVILGLLMKNELEVVSNE